MNKRGFSCIGLNNPKSSINVGSVIRAGGNYNVSTIFYTGNRYKKSCTDTMKTAKHIPIIHTDNLHDIIPFDCIPIAVDLVENAQCLYNFQHPERAFYIFGQEDGTLGKKILSWCKYKIYIPTERCMNLAASVNVVLYDRACKRNEYYDKIKIIP